MKQIFECFICGKKFVRYKRKLRGKPVKIVCCSNPCKFKYFSYLQAKWNGTKEWAEFHLERLRDEARKQT
jgi:hypothetical protein